MSEINSVIVAGSGPIAWICAAALLRANRQRALAVVVVDTGPGRDAPVGRWTLPSQRGMHALLGIAEPHFVQHTGATYKLATEHLGWQGAGSRFLHAHGDIGTELGGAPFYKFLQSEALAGRASPPEAFSVAGAAARLGKFARPMGEGRVLTATFTYGYHLEEQAYVRYLRAHALRLGVREASAPLADVLRLESGDIQGLRLTDGTTVSADYFIDCSGPEARLIGQAGAGDREDWSAWLPSDRMWSGFGPAAPDPAPVTQTVATSEGWSWRAPLAQATMVGHVFSSRFTDEARAFAALQASEPALRSEPVLTRFSAGRRRKFWQRNCVALGASAVELEPLAGASLHIAQIGLGTLIELFPLTRASTVEADEYNRLMAEHADALRDFTLAHYRAGPAQPGGFWAATRATSAPARLADKLEHYAASGRINLLDHESFEETDWAWLLLGSGCRPAALELQIRLRLEKLSLQEVNALRMHVQQLAASMPRHIDFVRHQASLAARAGT
jgi:tryptophan 7-halogenase